MCSGSMSISGFFLPLKLRWKCEFGENRLRTWRISEGGRREARHKVDSLARTWADDDPVRYASWENFFTLYICSFSCTNPLNVRVRAVGVKGFDLNWAARLGSTRWMEINIPLSHRFHVYTIKFETWNLLKIILLIRSIRKIILYNYYM